MCCYLYHSFKRADTFRVLSMPMSMMYKYLCFSAPLQSSLVSTINFRLCFVNPPNFYRITPKLTFMKYVLYLHVRIVARG